MKKKLPNFFIVGAPKAGTTSLYAYLNMHPEVYMPLTIKEPDFFSHEEILKQQLYYNSTHITSGVQYETLFKNVKEQKAVGEASVSYLFYPGTAKKIYDFNPLAKIIIILREPVERAYSHYLMDCRLGLIKDSFEEIILKKSSGNYADMYYQQIVLLGEYGNQVKRYIDLFGEKQVKILVYNQLTTDPKGLMKEIFSFLEIDENFAIDTSQMHNTYSTPNNVWVEKLYQMHYLRNSISKMFPDTFKNAIRGKLFKKSKKPEMSASAREFLRAHYKRDIEVVREIVGIKCW